jgi:hypothetical protein
VVVHDDPAQSLDSVAVVPLPDDTDNLAALVTLEPLSLAAQAARAWAIVGAIGSTNVLVLAVLVASRSYDTVQLFPSRLNTAIATVTVVTPVVAGVKLKLVGYPCGLTT